MARGEGAKASTEAVAKRASAATLQTTYARGNVTASVKVTEAQ